MVNLKKNKQFNCCTINTDAGFLPKEGVGSYAYYIKCGDNFWRGSGLFKDKCASSTDAETKAMVNALHIVLSSGVLEISKVIFNRDNIHAKTRGKNKPNNDVQILLKKKLNELKLRVKKSGSVLVCQNFYEYRHVKAHTNKDDKRSWVNRWCDYQCKRQLAEYRKNIKHG